MRDLSSFNDFPMETESIATTAVTVPVLETDDDETFGGAVSALHRDPLFFAALSVAAPEYGGTQTADEMRLFLSVRDGELTEKPNLYFVATRKRGALKSSEPSSTLVIDNRSGDETKRFVWNSQSPALSANAAAPTLSVTTPMPAASSYRVSTKWNQHSPYNKYCPLDRGKRAVTGCTNTAAAQIIYYWLSTKKLLFSLTIDSSDAYTSYGKSTITIDGSAAGASKYGYLAFSKVNKLLKNFKLKNTNCIAALCFAAGVVQQATYGYHATSTAWKSSLFVRAGFDSSKIGQYWSSNYYETTGGYFYSDYGLTSSGKNLLIGELKTGRPVAVSIRYAEGRSNGKAAHAIVADGYRSSDGKIHLNFGWGGYRDGWYSMSQLNYDLGIYQMMVGLTPKLTAWLAISAFTIKKDAVNKSGSITISFTVTNKGNTGSTATSAYLYCGGTYLSSRSVSNISAKKKSAITFTVSAATVALGKNSLKLRIANQKDTGVYSEKTQNITVYNGTVNSADNNWKTIRADVNANPARTTLLHNASGTVTNGIVASGEYVGYCDTIDYREFILTYSGKYTFTLSGTTGKIKFTLYSVTSAGKLKSLKSVTIAATKSSGSISGRLLKKGTYFLAVTAPGWKSHKDSNYNLSVSGTGYIQASSNDNNWSAAPSVTNGNAFSGWVGFGDTTDYREFTGIAETGGLYNFKLTGASNKVRLTVYEVKTTKSKGKTSYSLKSLKSVTATASASTGNLALSGKKRYIVAVSAVDASKGKNSNYTLTTAQAGIFTGTGNNTLAKATKLAAETSLPGMLSKVSGGDTVDFYDLASVKGQSLNLEMTSGTLKLTFCDKKGKAIKVSSLTMADNSTKKNISSLTLTNGTATGSIAFMASASNLRYLKIEAIKGGVNTYSLAVSALA